LGITLVPALLPTFLRGRLKSQEEVWLVHSFVNIYRPMLDYFIRHPDGIVFLTGLLMVISLPLFPRSSGVMPKMPWAFYVLLVPFILATTALLVARRWALLLASLGLLGLALYSFEPRIPFLDRKLAPLGEEFMPPLNELATMD